MKHMPLGLGSSVARTPRRLDLDRTGDVISPAQLVKTYGKSFDVLFRKQRVPFVVKTKRMPPKGLRKDERIVYHISIDYVTTQVMTYNTLQMTIDDEKDADLEAHIDYVNRNDEHKLSGAFVVELALALLKHIGVTRVTLYDAATVTMTGKEDCVSFELTPYLLLKKGTTFYGKWGFMPTNDWSVAYETDGQMARRLCALTARLQATKIASVLRIIARLLVLLRSLSSNKTKTLVTYDIVQDYETGVRAVQRYEDDYRSEEALKRFHDGWKATYDVLREFESVTVTEMMASCSCREYNALLRFFREFPGVIEVRKGNSRICNKYNAVFHEWHQIARGSSYARDMDHPRTGTCTSTAGGK